MRVSKIAIFLLMTGLITYYSCRKTDRQTESSAAQQESRFFGSHTSSNPVITAAMAFVQRQNEKYQFVNKLTQRIGYPYWNKSIAFENLTTPVSRSASDTADVVFIPFAMESGNSVDAALRVSMYGSDTTFKIITKWQYSDSASAGMNAKGQTLLLMSLDRSVFGHAFFKISDSTAFPMDTGRAAYVRLNNDLSTGSAVHNGKTQLASSTYLTICNEVWVPNEGYVTGCAPGEPCNGYHLVNQCTTWVVYDVTDEQGGNGGTGSTGTGGTSGGSGGDPSGGGGWIPLPCTHNCSGGYLPADDGLLQQMQIDSLLKACSIVANRFRDSLATLCESQHNERFFNIVKQNGVLDTFRVLSSPSADEVVPNFNMTGGRVLIGAWHYHPKYADGTPGSWPSGTDVAQLYDKQAGFVMIIDADNARYALVVEDITKMTTWKNILGHGPTLFPDKVARDVLSDPRAYSQGQPYVDMTKEKILAALGSAGICGMGLYQASTSGGTVFIKLN